MLRILAPALAAVALHATLLFSYAVPGDGDLSVLVCVGPDKAGSYPFEQVKSPVGTNGYDGMYYYALARSPWKRHGADLDCPGVRHLRILYPALCWLLSRGDPRALFWAMPLVNLLAIGGLAAFGASMARRAGKSAWWGVLLPLAVNALLPAMRNLTDDVSALAVCGLLCAWLWNWPAWSIGLWAAAALFSREQNAVLVLCVFVAALWQRRIG